MAGSFDLARRDSALFDLLIVDQKPFGPLLRVLPTRKRHVDSNTAWKINFMREIHSGNSVTEILRHQQFLARSPQCLKDYAATDSWPSAITGSPGKT